MRTKFRNAKKVNIVTLGCSKNIVDSEVMLGQLKGNGIDAYHERPEIEADVVVVNTCGFIDHAKEESIQTILNYADIKSSGNLEHLYVTGCLSQRYKDELQKEIPEVDAWFGTRELPLLLKRFKAEYRHELIGERLPTAAGHYAYLKIAEGCDRPCSFCAIPLMRGNHISRPIEELVAEAQKLAAKGVKELLVIAQDSTFYGLDLYKQRRLPELLDKLGQVEGIEWVRLHYAYPSGFPMDVLQVMNQNPSVCKYLDIPLQHGSSSVLKTMRRGIDRQKTEDLIYKIRETVPGIAIRTTLIAGHPGEGEAEFEEMRTFVETMKFDRLGVFTYSHEEGTHSGTLEDHVPQQIKEERADELMHIQEGISYENNQRYVDTVQKVLIDRKEANYWIGRSEFDSPEVDNEVLIEANDSTHLRVGDFVDCRITSADTFDLLGTPV